MTENMQTSANVITGCSARKARRRKAYDWERIPVAHHETRTRKHTSGIKIMFGWAFEEILLVIFIELVS